MRRRGLSPFRGNARLDGDDWLLLSDATYCVDEFPSIDYVLEVEKNDFGPRVPVKIFENVVFIHVGLVSHADELRDSNVLPTSIVEDSFSYSTALRSEGNRSLQRHARSEGCVESNSGVSVDYAKAVGTNHPDRVFLGDRGDLALEFCA